MVKKASLRGPSETLGQAPNLQSSWHQNQLHTPKPPWLYKLPDPKPVHLSTCLCPWPNPVSPGSSPCAAGSEPQIYFCISWRLTSQSLKSMAVRNPGFLCLRPPGSDPESHIRSWRAEKSCHVHYLIPTTVPGTEQNWRNIYGLSGKACAALCHSVTEFSSSLELMCSALLICI